MFEDLSKYRVIVVTGPQRSGTRIAAQMIANDTGHSFVDEREINIDSLYRFYDAYMLDKVVIQCPALARWIHHFSAEDTLICFMMRALEDIKASEKRVGWGWEPIEQIRYQVFTKPIAELKYDMWEHQKQYIFNWQEIEYKSLRSHPLWIPKDERAEFGALQTSHA